MNRILLALLPLFCLLPIHHVFTQESAAVSLPRHDGSFLDGYFLVPKDSTSPLVIAIQGSSVESSLSWYQDLSHSLSSLGFGLIVLERRGISQADIDSFEYNHTNCLQTRRQDYMLWLSQLESIIPWWQGDLIFLGESEGGLIAADLAQQFSKTIAALLFFPHGRMDLSEDVTRSICQRLEKHGEEEIDQYPVFLRKQMQTMGSDPAPDEWWASLLRTDTISTLLDGSIIPILLVHGTLDDTTPTLSIDLLATSSHSLNNLTYLLLGNYGHYLDSSHIATVASQWLQSTFFKQEISRNLSSRMGPPHTKTPSATVDQDGKVDISNCVCSRGEITVEVEVGRDTEGSQKASGTIEISKETDNGFSFGGAASGTIRHDREGNVKGEVSIEGSGTWRF